MAQGEEPKDEFADVPHERKEPRPDFSQPVKGKKVPRDIQENLDNDEKMWDLMYEGRGPDSTDTNARYAAYAARARTILRSAHRYIAYTSDVGESFRPIAHPYLVRSAYAVSWAYLIGDVGYEGYKSYIRNQTTLKAMQDTPPLSKQSPDILAKGDGTIDPETSSTAATMTAAAKDLVHKAPQGIPAIDDYRTVMAQRAIFQGVASMGLPAFTIHSIVRYSGRALKDSKNVRIRTYGPIGLGLAAVPFLPYLFDKPVEEGVEWVFHKGFEAFGGKDAVGHGESKKEL